MGPELAAVVVWLEPSLHGTRHPVNQSDPTSAIADKRRNRPLTPRARTRECESTYKGLKKCICMLVLIAYTLTVYRRISSYSN
jgi:hypothetical protein